MKTQSQGTVPYNNFLQPLGAPVSRHYDQGAANNLVPASTQYIDPQRPRFGGNSFDLGVSRDAIKTMHIKNFSFNAGTGGTLNLGGTNNGNGVEIIKDASGVAQVQIDNTGIAVNNGSITINNASNSLMLDSQGIRSTTNFSNSSALANIGLLQHFSSSTYSLITGMSFNITLTRTTTILLMGNVIGTEVYTGADSYIRGQVSIIVDGSPANLPTLGEGGVLVSVNYGFGNSTNVMMPIYEIIQLGSGAHTMELDAKRITITGADSDFVVVGVSFFYYLLGT